MYIPGMYKPPGRGSGGGMYSRQGGTEPHNHGDDFLDDNELSNYLDNIDTGANGLAVIYHFHDTGLGWKEMDILFLDEDGEVTDDSEGKHPIAR